VCACVCVCVCVRVCMVENVRGSATYIHTHTHTYTHTHSNLSLLTHSLSKSHEFSHSLTNSLSIPVVLQATVERPTSNPEYATNSHTIINAMCLLRNSHAMCSLINGDTLSRTLSTHSEQSPADSDILCHELFFLRTSCTQRDGGGTGGQHHTQMCHTLSPTLSRILTYPVTNCFHMKVIRKATVEALEAAIRFGCVIHSPPLSHELWHTLSRSIFTQKSNAKQQWSP